MSQELLLLLALITLQLVIIGLAGLWKRHSMRAARNAPAPQDAPAPKRAWWKRILGSG